VKAICLILTSIFFPVLQTAAAEDLKSFAESASKKEWLLEYNRQSSVTVLLSRKDETGLGGRFKVQRRSPRRSFWNKIFGGKSDNVTTIAEGRWAPASASNRLILLFNPIFPDDSGQVSKDVTTNFLGVILRDEPTWEERSRLYSLWKGNGDPVYRNSQVIPVTFFPDDFKWGDRNWGDVADKMQWKAPFFTEGDWVNTPLGEYEGRKVYTNKSGWKRLQGLDSK